MGPTRWVVVFTAAGLALAGCTGEPEPELTVTHPVEIHTNTPSATPSPTPTQPRRPVRTPRSEVPTPAVSLPNVFTPITDPPITVHAEPAQAFLLRLEGIEPQLTENDNSAEESLRRGLGLCPATRDTDTILNGTVRLAYRGVPLDDSEVRDVSEAVRQLCGAVGPDAP